MVILVAILIIALIAAVAYAVMQRRPARAPGVDRPRTAPIGRRGVARRDPMAAAVAEHARAMDPADVVVAEQRLQAEARQVAAGLQPATQPGAYPPVPPAPVGAAPYATDPSLDRHFDPATGERVDGYGDPANDPRYNDPDYDGRLAADWVDPRYDDRIR